MKKEKNTFENEVIKIDNIIVKIDPETREYKFAILRTFNNFPIEVDLRNKRVPKNSNREYRKLVKITKEQNKSGVYFQYRTLNDRLQVVMSKDAIAKIEELTGIADENILLAVKVSDIRRWENELNAIECLDEAVRAEAKKALQPTDPISATVAIIGKGVKKGGEMVKNFLETLGNNGDTSKNLSLPEIAKREGTENQAPAEQAKVEGLDNLTSTDYNTQDPNNGSSESEGM